MESDVESRKRNGGREAEHERRESRYGESEGHCCREARGRVTGRKRRRRRRRHQRDVTELLHRPRPAHGVLQSRRREIGGHDDEHDNERNAGAAKGDSGRSGDCEPNEPPGARVGQPHEHGIEPTDAMLDDPPFETVIEVDQGPVVTVVVTVTVSRVAAIGTTVRTRVCAAPGLTSELVAWPRATPSAKTAPKAADIRSSARRAAASGGGAIGSGRSSNDWPPSTRTPRSLCASAATSSSSSR